MGSSCPHRSPSSFIRTARRLNAWTPDPANHRRATFWFARHSGGDWSYRQQLVIVYDNQPDKAYYYDPYTREFRGRFDMKARAYSLLPPDSRRGDVNDIDPAAFPPPGVMPTIEQMTRRPDDRAPGSGSRILAPPSTAEFPPRLGIAMEDAVYEENGVGQFRGVRITGIERGSPAEEADLNVGDIILRVDGIRTYNYNDVQVLISRAGRAVTLTLRRSATGQYVTTSRIRMDAVAGPGPAPPTAPPAPPT